MLRAKSEVLTNNTHSLNRKSSPFSLQNSKADSVSKNRKMSMASIKDSIPDLEKLIMDIKISPGNGNGDMENIKKIQLCLSQLQKNENLQKQIHTVKMIMETVQRKLVNPPYNKVPRLNSASSSKKNSLAGTSAKLSEISPIKQIGEQVSSRIVYTNFSLRDADKSGVEEKQNNSLQSSFQKSGSKVTVSNFQESSELHNNSEVERLNDQIKYLQDLLMKKTGGNKGMEGIFKKKSNKY